MSIVCVITKTCFFFIFPGQSGLGKSTLVNTLFKSKVSRKSCTPEYEAKISKTVKLQKISHGWSLHKHTDWTHCRFRINDMHMLLWDGDNQVKCNYDTQSWLSITINNDIEINFTCTFLDLLSTWNFCHLIVQKFPF